MKIVNSNLVPSIKEVYQTELGNFYFFEDYIVSEINEGVIFNWESSKEMISLVYDFYGENPNIHIISNRVNNYSVVPTYWLEFNKSIHAKSLLSVSFVTYSELGLANAKLEQDFIKVKTACFKSIKEVIHWLDNSSQKRTA